MSKVSFFLMGHQSHKMSRAWHEIKCTNCHISSPLFLWRLIRESCGNKKYFKLERQLRGANVINSSFLAIFAILKTNVESSGNKKYFKLERRLRGANVINSSLAIFANLKNQCYDLHFNLPEYLLFGAITPIFWRFS
jgi:hypothetical protein